MVEQTLAEMIADLRRSQAAFLDILSRTNDEVLYRRPAGDSWTLAETLVHIAEARQFFTGQTRKVLATPGAQMGRTLEHAGRLQNVKDHGRDSLDVIRHKMITSHQDLLELLSEMSDDDLQITGEHVRLGPQTLAEFIRRLMVEHDQLHVRQATALLAGEPASE